MKRIKSLSRAGWMVVGIVMALIIVPSGVAMATLAYTGIQGTNGTTVTNNKAHVSSAGQLLTTEATPNKYEEYQVGPMTAQGANGGSACLTAATIPAGEAFLVQQVDADVYEANSPTTYSSPSGTNSTSRFAVFADTATQTCPNGDLVTAGEAPGGTVGNVAIPIVPGYVVPSGYHLNVLAFAIDAGIYISGYLVPSDDAPTSPTN